MANVVNKLWNMINMNTAEDEEYDEEYEDEEIENEAEEESRGFLGLGRKQSGKVVTMQPQARMVIMQPTEFEQAEEICDLLKDRKSIIINLEYVNKDVARRIIDVISGAVHVLEGHMQKISNSIFVVAPYNYEISSNTKEEGKGPVSWLKGNANN